MKKKLSDLFFYFWLLTLNIQMCLYRIKNFRKKRILIYTDSRGHEITQIWNKHNPFSGYARYFIKKYRTTAHICPEKFTTFFDFLYFISKNKRRYDYVICHTGVVDFAPRTKTQTAQAVSLKERKICAIFGAEILSELRSFEGYDVMYEKEKTSSIVPEFLISEIAEKLNAIPNIIWISCTPISNEWQGNYRKNRPTNSNIVNEKSLFLIEKLKTDKIVNFTNISLEDIKKYTCDNVHLSVEGMHFVEAEVRKMIE